MSEQAKLLRAIWDDPADDTVRLAYADFLDENDLTPHHAALIRGQIGGTFPQLDVAFVPPPAGTGKWFVVNVTLDGAHSLLADILPPREPWWDLGIARIVVRRGFPDELQIPSEWLVRTCRRCHGDGSYEGGFNSTYYCEECGDGRTKPGTGRVPGPAVEMFRFPITKVAYTDREPANTRRKGGGGPNSRTYAWFRAGADGVSDFETRVRTNLPPELFPGPPERRRANYPRKEDALKAASDRAVEYGRTAKIPAEHPPFSFAGALPPE